MRSLPGRHRLRSVGVPRWVVVGVATGALGLGVIGCATVDPDEITCRELITEPDKLRQTSLRLAGSDVPLKVRWEDEISRLCTEAPESTRPVPIIHRRIKGM